MAGSSATTQVVETTLGRFCSTRRCRAVPLMNYEIRKGQLSMIVNDLAERYPKVQLAATLDALKEAGFHWATWSGVTIGIEDVVQPPRKWEILGRYEKEAERIDKQYQRGLMTAEERRGELIEIWTKATNEVAKEMETALPQENPLWMMIHSGARGNLLQLRQISAIRGLVPTRMLAHPAAIRRRSVGLPCWILISRTVPARVWRHRPAYAARVT